MGDGTRFAGRTALAALLLLGALGLPACPDPGDEGAASDSAAPAAPPRERAPEPAEPVAPPRETERDLAEAAEEPLGRHFDERYPARLQDVVDRRYLRVLTSRNAFDYFVDDGAPGGYQYEMVRAFARFLNERHVKGQGGPRIQFELVPVDDDRLIPMLLEGAGDLVAARLTITPERARRVRFSRPYRTVDEVLVTHEGTAPLETLEALSGRTVAIRATSSYAESLERLDARLVEMGRPPVDVVFVDEALATERILELVAARRFPFTVADSLVAELAGRIHPSLRALDALPLRRDRKLAWATRPEATELAREMDAFLARYREGSLLGNLVAQRYFEAERRLAKRLADGGGRGISDFDPIFREHASAFGLDWRLVAAMAYQESRFDPEAHNRWGAVGLMQIKPKTAREPYVGVPEVSGAAHASDNVRAGLTYLYWIKQRYFDDEPGMRERDRLRMALAAYNAGPKTILRARARARKRGLDPDRWFRNVELALLEMRRSEPVRYVSEINQRYLSYVLLGFE